jgi:hypothetical protein
MIMGTWLPQNMYRMEINIHEKIVRHFRYLQGPYKEKNPHSPALNNSRFDTYKN